MTRLVLASQSATRMRLLKAAGIAFTAVAPSVDERAIEAPLVLRGASPAEIAVALADAKAIDVSESEKDALVIGADQTLDCDGERWTKPPSLAVAHQQLARLCGRTHRLHTAVAVARNGRVSWRYRDSASLTMRTLSAAAIDAYLGEVGDAARTSVGAYQVEGPGIRLFERIDGDYFTILGLPLLPLLLYLRGEGAIP